MMTRSTMCVTAALGLAIGFGGTAIAQPAFDCAKAEHEIEDLICQDADLAAMDRELSGVYSKALDRIAGFADRTQAEDALKTTQRGWIGGRNDCWKADDKRQCTVDSYERRISGLQAQFVLVQGGEPVFYRCDDNSEFVVTFMQTNLPTARIERGDTTEIFWLSPSASGSRYEGEFGLLFWIKGDDAQVEWPQGTAFACRVSQ